MENRKLGQIPKSREDGRKYRREKRYIIIEVQKKIIKER